MDYLEKRKLVRAGTRANLLSNRLVLIAPADSKAVIDDRSPIPAGSAIGGQTPGHGRSGQCSGRQVWAGCTRSAGSVGGGCAQGGACGERACRAGAGRTRRNAVRHRLCTDAVAERKVRVIGEFAAHLPSGYRVSCRVDERQQVGKGRGVSCSSCVQPKRDRSGSNTDSGLRGRTVLSATEVDIILLSLKVAVWSVLASLPFAIAVAHVPGAPRLSRQEPRGRVRPPAARIAAGGHRLLPVDPARPPRARSGHGLRTGLAWWSRSAGRERRLLAL